MISFEEFWEASSSTFRENPEADQQMLSWVLDDVKEEMLRIFEAETKDVLCVAMVELMTLSARHYGVEFGLPKVEFRSTKLRPAWLQYVYENSKRDDETP